MRISACRGKQIALWNIKYTPKIGRGNYLTYLFKSILINKGWKRRLPVCSLNCVSLAIWNLIHSHVIPHTGASTSDDSDVSGHFWTRLQFSLGTHTVVFLLWQQRHLRRTHSMQQTASRHSLTVICVSCLKSRTRDTNLSAFCVGGDERKHRLDWNCAGMKHGLWFIVIVPLVLIPSPRSLFGFLCISYFGSVNTRVWIWETHPLSRQISSKASVHLSTISHCQTECNLWLFLKQLCDPLPIKLDCAFRFARY